MSSVYYGGLIRMNPESEMLNRDPMFEGGYPFTMPKVYLDGVGESYFPQWCFNWDDDSVIVVRDKRVVKYTRSSFEIVFLPDTYNKMFLESMAVIMPSPLVSPFTIGFANAIMTLDAAITVARNIEIIFFKISPLQTKCHQFYHKSS